MIFGSPHSAVTIPEQHLTDYVLRFANALAEKPALIDGPTGCFISYQELKKQVIRLATGLSTQGLRKGDVFAILSPNLPEFVLGFHAAALLGATTTMVPPLFTYNEINAQLKDSGVSYLLTTASLMSKAQNAIADTNVKKLFVIGEAEGATSLESLLNNEGNIPTVPINLQEDVVALPYSSGTTGFPKGVMLTHRNLVAMLAQMEAIESFDQNDVIVCVVPMYHLYGLHLVANLGLSQGATVVTLPRFDLDEFLKVIETYQVTVAPVVPPIVLALARSPKVKEYSLSSLRLIQCGAATLADNVAQACSNRLGCDIRYGYGLTEVSPLSHVSSPNREKRKRGSVGYCLPNTECKIVALNGSELGPEQKGEICVRGPQVMKGYLGNPEATAEMIDKDGWLRTGDIGYVDGDGSLFVIDRLKELIKYKGRQVAPAELEAVLLSHPAVADAGVIPVENEEAGEIPKAYVVLKGEATGDEIMEFVASRVAPHKRVREVEFTNEIPKSPAGKILRRLLIERERTKRKS